MSTEMSASVWLVENRSTVRCICCRWTLYPKINFQSIRTCLTHAQIRRMTVGHVSLCIVRFMGLAVACVLNSGMRITLSEKSWNPPSKNTRSEKIKHNYWFKIVYSIVFTYRTDNVLIKIYKVYINHLSIWKQVKTLKHLDLQVSVATHFCRVLIFASS